MSLPSSYGHRPTRAFISNPNSSLVALAITLACLLVFVSSRKAAAEVFHSRAEIDDLAFPDSDRVETRDIFLSTQQRSQIERLAGSTLDSALLTIYEGYRESRLIGYAVLDTHQVRTLAETLLVILDPTGSVAATYLMAFHEPLEYRPNERWLALMKERRLSDDLRVGRGVVGITGATLSSRAAVSGVRRALAIYQVLLANP